MEAVEVTEAAQRNSSMHSFVDRHRLQRILYWMIAIILWSAAMMKAKELLTNPTLDHRIGRVLLIEAEWLLGLWLVSGMAMRAAWMTTACVFTGFSLYAAYLLFQGDACGCFGEAEIPPWVMLIMNISIVALLIGFSPKRKDTVSMSSPRSRLIIFASLAMVVAMPAFLVLAQEPEVPAENTDTATAAETEATKPSSILERDLGYIEPASNHRVAFRIHNDGDKDMVIEQFEPECSCMKVSTPPDVILPGESLDVEVILHAFENPTQYAKDIQVIPEEGKPLTLILRARIGLPLRVFPQVIEFDPDDPPQETTLTIHNDGPKPVKLLYATTDIPEVVAKVPSEPIQPNSSVEVPVTFGQTVKQGSIRIRTTWESQKSLTVQVGKLEQHDE